MDTKFFVSMLVVFIVWMAAGNGAEAVTAPS